MGATSGAGTTCPSRAPESCFFSRIHVVQSLVFCVVFCRPLFVFVTFFWPISVVVFKLRFLIFPLLSSNFSHGQYYFTFIPHIFLGLSQDTEEVLSQILLVFTALLIFLC